MEKLKTILQNAHQQKHAIPAYNFNDMWDLSVICETLASRQKPVLAMTYTPVVELLGPDFCVDLVHAMRKKYQMPLYLHLDHCGDVQMCLDAIHAGYDSVMYDASHLSLEDNIAGCCEVIACARKHNVIVEAEIGKIQRAGSEEDGDFLAQVDDVKKLTLATDIDMLAVAVGTVHGFYQGEPNIDFKRLKDIAEAIPSMPLVLHGGTGIAQKDLQKSIALGVSKINVGTAIHTAYMQGLKAILNESDESAYPPFIMPQVMPLIKEQIEYYAQAILF